MFMDKDKYFEIRNKLIEEYESGTITDNEFCDKMAVHAEFFKPEWTPQKENNESKLLASFFSMSYGETQKEED